MEAVRVSGRRDGVLPHQTRLLWGSQRVIDRTEYLTREVRAVRLGAGNAGNGGGQGFGKPESTWVVEIW